MNNENNTNQLSSHSTGTMHHNMKVLALVFSSLVSLASGTPYLYGVYSPQLINRCGFSAIDSSYLSFAANIGSSIGGFFAGLFIDKFGSTLSILLGAVLEFSGFFILFINYKYQLHRFSQLSFAMISIGFGSVLAYFSTIKVATVNFPRHRGVANACPVSAYGLAALFYAFISTVYFSDDTEGLLKFIAIFSGLTMGLSSLFIGIYEHEDGDANDHVIDDDDDDENSSENESDLDKGLQYLLKGHRGSMAQVNLIKSDSSTSLFSNVSDVSSTISSSTNNLSRDSSFSSLHNTLTSSTVNKPISIKSQQQIINRSNSNSSPANGLPLPNPHLSNSILSSSPLDFKTKQSIARTNSYRQSSSISNSPKNSHWFGSMAQKSFKINSSNNNAVIDEGTPLMQNENSVVSNPISISSSPDISNQNLILNSSPHNSFNQSSSNAILFLPTEVSNTAVPTTSSNENLQNSQFLELLNKQRKKQKSSRSKKLSSKDHILKLMRNRLFLSQYILNSFYCAFGQVYIYGVGFIVRAQINNSRLHPNSVFLQLSLSFFNSQSSPNLALSYQALQVSIISFANFIGRLISGPASDLVSKSWKKNRLWVVVISLIFMTLGQLSLLLTNNIDSLSITSFLIGLSYGSFYGTMPSIVADNFGSTKFATTWALLGTGPITVFLIISDYFGIVYDKNSEWSRLGDIKMKMCLKGNTCYWDVFALNSVGCILLFVGYFAVIYANAKK